MHTAKRLGTPMGVNTNEANSRRLAQLNKLQCKSDRKQKEVVMAILKHMSLDILLQPERTSYR